MSSRHPSPLRRALVMVSVAAALRAGMAHAYDPATTHAGLTERAILASSLHRVLSRRLLQPLGLFEPISLRAERIPLAARRALTTRLGTLDPAGGYRPSDEGSATALAWVVAGSVIAGAPPERGRNHFYDPSRRVGLDDRAGLTAYQHGLYLFVDGGSSLRGLATGTAFDLTGEAAPAWLLSPVNELGVPALHDHLEASLTSPDPADRESELARALMALGGVLSVLEDMGEPAHVRNDFRDAFLGQRSGSTFDRGSAYERHVADRFGRLGVPAPRKPVRRPNLQAYISAPDGAGLADRTHRRFFSEGSVPHDVMVEPDMTPRDVVQDARESLTYPRPTVPRLELRDVHAGRTHYLRRGATRILAYRRLPGGVRFFLDEAVHSDVAQELLPEIGAYAAGLIDHLLRGELPLRSTGEGIEVSAPAAPIRGGKLRVFFEDDAGVRREASATSGAADPATAAAGSPLATVIVPGGARKVVAVLRGEDDAGPVVAVGELRLAH